MRCLLTEDMISNANPKPKPSFLWDKKVTGLGVKINPKGRKVYVVQYRDPGRKSRRVTLAACDELSLTNARERAVVELMAVRNGEKAQFRETAYRLEIMLPNLERGVAILNQVLSRFRTNDLSVSLKPATNEDVDTDERCESCGSSIAWSEWRGDCLTCGTLIGLCCCHNEGGEPLCKDCAGGVEPQ